MQVFKTTLVLLLACSLVYSCKKSAQSAAPTITLKSGAGLISESGIVAQGQTLTIAVAAQSTEDNLSRLSVSTEFDHSGNSSSFKSFSLEANEQEHCEKEISFTTRNRSGSEKWIVTVEDRNGHSAHTEIELTVR